MAKWWQQDVIYHIYPLSYQDSNGDGIGDLNGIWQRLDYLVELGVDALWLSPIYPSPMADFGYDVSCYTNVAPVFGTLQEFDELLSDAHARNLKIILDFVPNHTSHQHPWFLESRASLDNPKRDWYIWRDPAPDGGPPNNWLSRYDGNSAWSYDEHTGQYYLHTFLPEQPDLNWRNPEVLQAMLRAMQFWLDRGVDGFRVDVPHRVLKDPLFRDNPPNVNWRPSMHPFLRFQRKYTEDLDDVHLFNRWLRKTVDLYKDRVLIGEINLPMERLVAYYGNGDEFHLPFNFGLIFCSWNATAVRQVVEQYEALLPIGMWPSWVLGNHDRHRVATRVGKAQARVAMMLLLTLHGTPTLYYGDELGMENAYVPREQVRDPWGAITTDSEFGRDPARTPMQWDASPHAGFCSAKVKPWLTVAQDYETHNVDVQRSLADSMLTLTKRLLALRRHAAALRVGTYRSIETPENLFAYIREAEEERYLIVLNFTDRSCVWSFPPSIRSPQPVLSTYLDESLQVQDQQLRVRGNEGLVLRLTA